MVVNSIDTSASRSAKLELLCAATRVWFTVAALGQFAFAGYIMLFYGGTALAGDWAAWTRRLIHGFVEGDFFGNLTLLAHMALAFIILVGGPLQFVPFVRNRWRRFHRWNGRIYVVAVIMIALGGLYLTWSRGMGLLFNDTVISINAVLMVVFAGVTVFFAIRGVYDSHHRWALRLFMVASGVWFFRVGYGFWFVVTGGTMPGVGSMLDGPVDYGLAVGSYLAPVIILEVYLRARDSVSRVFRAAATALVFSSAAVTGAGLVGAAMMFWLPTLLA